jgi:hypothetical protein
VLADDGLFSSSVENTVIKSFRVTLVLAGGPEVFEELEVDGGGDTASWL